MQDKAIIMAAMCFAYYHISGLATTNILRLTKGSTLNILSPQCICDNCGGKINPFLQLPIISYIICKGKCRKCGTKIPVFPLLLELAICAGTYLISFICDFSLLSVLLCFIFYEFLRILVVAYLGKRSSNFVKQYLIAVLMTLVHFSLISFMALLKTIV